jgi:hypothetical protein
MRLTRRRTGEPTGLGWVELHLRASADFALLRPTPSNRLGAAAFELELL